MLFRSVSQSRYVAGIRFFAKIDSVKRKLTENNHTATHLMHSALIKVLDSHVQQKGSLVNEERLRFDFSHFAKVSPEEIEQIERIVNEKIRENIHIEEHRELEMEQAKSMNATALFGEKYGDKVRVVAFDAQYSAELCGGTHVGATGQIGLFKIVSEGAIAAGIRRIEAITGAAAEELVNAKLHELEALRSLLKNPKNAVTALEQMLEQNDAWRKAVEQLQKEKTMQLIPELLANAIVTGKQIGRAHV